MDLGDKRNHPYLWNETGPKVLGPILESDCSNVVDPIFSWSVLVGLDEAISVIPCITLQALSLVV